MVVGIRLRCFIGKWQVYVVFLVLGLLFMAVGGLFVLGGMTSAQPTRYDPNYQGFGVYSNSTVKDASTDIVLTTAPASLYFQHLFTVSENGTYCFAFWFPFHVTTTVSESEEMLVNSTSSGTVIVVKHNATIGHGASQQVFSGIFNIDETFLSGNKGSFAIVIPFGGFSETLENIARDLDIRYFSQGKVTFYMDIPYQNDISSEFPPVSRGILQWGKGNLSNQTVSRLTWDFDRLSETVIVKYEQSYLLELTENFILIGGIIFGIGSSIFVSAVYDWTKDWWQRKRAWEYHQKG